MALTASRLKAVVSAETDDANRKLKQFGDTVSKMARGLGVNVAQFAGPAGIGLAVAGLAKAAISADDLRQRFQNTERQLTAYAGSTASAVAATDALVRATDGGVSKLQAMGMASQLLGMGLATTSDQVYQLTRMAALLGDKTMSVEERMASWNAMLANQSIERLDTFGISSGRVRQRIEELQAANQNLTREQAFVNAVLEIGGSKLKAVEAAGVTAASGIDQVRSSWSNLTAEIAKGVNLQGAEQGLANVLNTAASVVSGAYNQPADIAVLTGQIASEENRIAQARAELAKLGPEAYNADLVNAYKAEIEQANARLADLRLQLGGVQTETNGAGSAMLALGNNAAYVASQVASVTQAFYDYGSAASSAISLGAKVAERKAGATSVANMPNQAWYNGGSGSFYGSQFQATLEAQRKAGDEALQRREELKRAGEQGVKSIAQTWERSMNEATQRIAGKFSEAANFSKGLNDLTGGNPLAPGSNGPFEDIYRLQAWLKGGSWGETAAKYGYTDADKAKVSETISAFQKGNFTDEVLKLVNVGQLQNILKGESDATASQDRLAKLLGVDAGQLAKLTGRDIAGQGTVLDQKQSSALTQALQNGMTQIDFKGALADNFLKAVDAELVLKKAEIEAKGAYAWDMLEKGMLSKAGKSTNFVAMVESMVDNALANYVPPS